ncbi:unnamed protein product [Closterium sp. Naga37s-1]|nr:unnamed protein product [Closterium sp. Naga37s-1]
MRNGFESSPALRCHAAVMSGPKSGICVVGTPLGAVACGKARSKTVANRRYSVGAGDSCASLVVVQFQRQPPLVGLLNRNWMCRSQSLFAGMPLCIPS